MAICSTGTELGLQSLSDTGWNLAFAGHQLCESLSLSESPVSLL